MKQRTGVKEIMLGAIIGDICGSRYEWANIKSKQFQLFKYQCRPTDDSIMTLAIAQAILTADGKWEKLSRCAVASMQSLGRSYPGRGYGGRFHDWLTEENPQPYYSWGNGAGMRVSPCAWAAGSLEEALMMSDAVTAVTHDHPEGLKGARAITAGIYLAREGKSMDEIRNHIAENYYPLDFTLDSIRKNYRFDVSCQGSVPQAIEAFLESGSYEDAVRGAISIGGDSDTIAAMAGSIAEAFWGIPDSIRQEGMRFMDDAMIEIVKDFETKYGTKITAC